MSTCGGPDILALRVGQSKPNGSIEEILLDSGGELFLRLGPAQSEGAGGYLYPGKDGLN